MREKQSDQDMWRREVDQKMARLMNLREGLPKEVGETNVLFQMHTKMPWLIDSQSQ